MVVKCFLSIFYIFIILYHFVCKPVTCYVCNGRHPANVHIFPECTNNFLFWTHFFSVLMLLPPLTNLPIPPHPLRIPSVCSTVVNRLFNGCLPVFIVEQPVNSRRTDGEGTGRCRSVGGEEAERQRCRWAVEWKKYCRACAINRNGCRLLFIRVGCLPTSIVCVINN